MRIFLVFLSPLFLSCASTAFLPSYKKTALVHRQVLAPTSDIIRPKTRFVSYPLFYSIAEEISKLNKGNEDDKMSKEEYKLVRDVLRKIVSQDTPTNDLANFVFDRHQASFQLPSLQKTATKAATSVQTLTDPAVAVSKEQVEGQGKDAFRILLTIFELLKDAVDSDYEDISYATYPSHKEFPDVSLAEMMKHMDGLPPLEYFMSRKKVFRLITRLLNMSIGLAMTEKQVKKATTVEDKYKAIFTNYALSNKLGEKPYPFELVPAPDHALFHWDEDKEFARQFLNGVNPLMIRVVKDVEKDLTKDLIHFLKKNETIDLESLAEKKRLFFVSYDDLAELKANPHQAFPAAYNPEKKQDQPRYFTAPIVVFQLTKDLQELEVLAIQLDRKKDAEIFSAATSDPTTWLFAKVQVTAADSQMHEWVTHLGRTHFTMEPLIIAMHNTLKKKNHPLFTFFRPLIRDTLFLGFAARNSLAQYGASSFGDRVTSVGVGQFMQLVKKYWGRYSFFESSGFENELASRGFDKNFKIPCYYYREDGMKLWNAYGRFAMDFLDEIYATDSDVAKDTVLQQWAKETTDKDKAAIPGFPKSFKDKKTVAATMQTLFWISSGLHAAVNFPQYDYYAYQANKPLSMRKSMEHFQQSDTKDRNWIFSEALPDVKILRETILAAQALTLPSTFCIDNLSDNFSTTGAGAYKKFKNELKVIGDGINARNLESKRNGGAIYPYLHPSIVPAAIDI